MHKTNKIKIRSNDFKNRSNDFSNHANEFFNLTNDFLNRIKNRIKEFFIYFLWQFEVALIRRRTKRYHRFLHFNSRFLRVFPVCSIR